MVNEKDAEPIGPDSFGGEDFPSKPIHDPEWDPPTGDIPSVPATPDSFKETFLRVEKGLSDVKKDRARLETNLDTLIQDFQSLRLSLEARFTSIERRLSNVESKRSDSGTPSGG